MSSRFASTSLFACAGASAFLAGCSSDDEESNDSFVLRSTGQAISTATSELLGDGDWLAYLVSEAAQGVGGTDFNGDGDTNDGIAVRVNTASRSVLTLNVAATQLAFARRTLFMSVDEAEDGRDWTRDGDMLDTAILYVTPTQTEPTLLDEAAPNSELIAIGGTVVYAAAEAPTVSMESNLRASVVATTGAEPGMPEMVLTGADPNNDGISFAVQGSDGDIVFLEADETVDGDLNGDGDALEHPPAHLGEPVFGKLKARLAQAFLSIGAVTGFGYGRGFETATLRGTEYIADEANFGGILGGVSSGETMRLLASVKPTTSIGDVAKKGRHDPCIVPRVIPVLEAMTAIVLADCLLEHRARTN